MEAEAAAIAAAASATAAAAAVHSNGLPHPPNKGGKAGGGKANGLEKQEPPKGPASRSSKSGIQDPLPPSSSSSSSGGNSRRKPETEVGAENNGYSSSSAPSSLRSVNGIALGDSVIVQGRSVL